MKRNETTYIASMVLAVAIPTAIMFATMSLSTGCAHQRVVVIPSDKQITFLKAGESHTATNDIYLVPPARMLEIMRALREASPIP